MTATLNHALQRTAPCVTADASASVLRPAVQPPHRVPRSPSLGALGAMNLAPLKFVGLTAICICVFGCSRPVPPQTQSANPPLYTEADVQSFVLPGTKLDEIVKRFGQPFYDDRNPKFEGGSTDIDEIVYFDLGPPQPGAKEVSVFSGFQVRLKDGKAVQWYASHRSTN